MGEAAEILEWWTGEKTVDMSDYEDVAYLATGETDEIWLYGSD